MARRKRVSPRRQEGKRLLELLPQYDLMECDGEKPVTCARRFIESHQIKPPALVVVQRNHVQERFFWGIRGLFSAQYVEENHFLFPSLDLLRAQIEPGAESGSVA